MRALIQRVKKASVDIEGKTKGKIGNGLLILLGIEDSDNEQDIEWLSAKITKLRIFDDDNGVMNRSVVDVDGEVMLVSQFTLHANVKKGNRPSYIRASKPDIAIPLYEKFKAQLEKDTGKTAESGEFGAMMNISLVNNGPVTIFIDTKKKE